MKRATSLSCGITASCFFIIFGTVFMVISFFINGDKNETPKMIMGILGACLIVIGVLNFLAVSFAPNSKLMLVLLGIFAGFGLIFGGIIGILNLVSFVKIRQAINNGDTEYVSLKERRRMRKARKQEMKNRMRSDRTYAKFINYLRFRKVKSIIRSIFLTALSYIISFPVLIYVFYPLLDEIFQGSQIFILLIIYVIGALLILMINGIEIGYTVDSKTVKKTDYYKWQQTPGLFGTTDYELNKVDTKVKEKYHTSYIFSFKTILFLLFGWLMFIPQTIGLLFNLLIKYNSERFVCGIRPAKIPPTYLRVPFAIGNMLSFFFGFVPVDWGYLDYIYDLV